MIAKKYLIENYDCSEYLAHYENGCVIDNCLQLILPYKDISIHPTHQHLTIGYIDKSELEVCYQFQTPGIWIFYPGEKRYKQINTSLYEFISDYKNGSFLKLIN